MTPGAIDFAVVGSGFGGSVAALRLAEKGYRVVVLEQGRRIEAADLEAGRRSMRKLLWAPRLGLHGYFRETFLRHVGIISGVGVGGGSLVYAAVLLEPPARSFAQPAWQRTGVDWMRELRPHWDTAARMLGRTTSGWFGPQDEALLSAARALGAESTFEQVPLGIHFGQPGVEIDDPYLGGAGPRRTGCVLCGGCVVTGCAHGAKNTLDKNYLHLAEAAGVQVRPCHQATLIRPVDGGGFAIEVRDPIAGIALPAVHARRVVLAAGVLGTVELLAASRAAGALPDLSPRLGCAVRTNSEALVGVLADDESVDLSRGPGISTHFWADEHTHITQNRFSAGQAALRLQLVPMVDDHRPVRRALRTLGHMARHPLSSSRPLRARRWHQRLTMMTVMQDVDNRFSLVWERGGLRSRLDGERPPSYLPQANRAARAFADAIGGMPLSLIFESLAGMSLTAHILGGCAIGRDPSEGVIDTRHRVFGYPDLWVADGAAFAGNLGVNPSLTITAMAERAMSLVPAA